MTEPISATQPAPPPPAPSTPRQPTRVTLEHSARTTVAALLSLLVASVCRLPETYWAAITTIIVMQSTLGAAWTVSVQRLIGTALGSAAGAFLGWEFGASILAFGAGLLGLGIICTVLKLDRVAYRFAGITLVIVLLIGGPKPFPIIAVHRFIEVTVGIAVALALTAIWPER